MQIPQFESTLREYVDSMLSLGHGVMSGTACHLLCSCNRASVSLVVMRAARPFA